LGTPETATQRLNFSQSFNGLAATLAPLLGGIFILSGRSISDADLQALTPEAAEQLLQTEAESVQVPYLVIAGLVLLLAFIVWRSVLPEIKEDENEGIATDAPERPIYKEANLMRGVIAQFFYVGAQVCITSFFIRFAGKAAEVDEKTAAKFLSAAMLAFMIGRFAGTAFMKFIAPSRLLLLYSLANIVLLLMMVYFGGMVALYALIAVTFFMSIMFPTIFSLGIAGLGSQTKLGSSLIIMAIAGGALLPVIMGYVSDQTSIQTAYIVPAVCFVAVAWFAVKSKSKDPVEIAVHH
jgi:FHS family L-fucose permease-like MFS transporter